MIVTALVLALPPSAGALTRSFGGLGGKPTLAVLHPHWVSLHGQRLVATVGAYVIQTEPDSGTIGEVVDDQTGQVVGVPAAPDCQPHPSLLTEAPGATSIAAACYGIPSIDLYPLPAGPWRSIPMLPVCLAPDGLMGSCQPVAAGRYWVSYALNSYHSQTGYEIQSVATGGGPIATYVGPGQVSDLSSPTLGSPRCRSFAESVDGTTITDDGFVVRQHNGAWTLRRCGAPASTAVAVGGEISPPGVRPGLVMWTTPTQINGIVLPSQRRFELSSPVGAQTLTSVTVTPAHVYVTAIVLGPSSAAPRYRTWVTTRPRPHG